MVVALMLGDSRTYPKPTLNSITHAPHVSACHQCQKTGNISHKHEMPMNYILVCDIFDGGE